MKTPRVVLLVMALALTAAACGGGDSGADDTTAPTATAAPISTAAPTSTAAPATSTAPATTMAAGDATTMAPSGDGIEIMVITQGDRFDTKEIVVTAGQEVTITVDDRDTETDDPHNFHVRAGDLNFFTLIEDAPNIQTLTFTIDTPGVYEFFCDTHAETMFGDFIVEEEM